MCHLTPRGAYRSLDVARDQHGYRLIVQIISVAASLTVHIIIYLSYQVSFSHPSEVKHIEGKYIETTMSHETTRQKTISLCC